MLLSEYTTDKNGKNTIITEKNNKNVKKYTFKLKVHLCQFTLISLFLILSTQFFNINRLEIAD